MTSHAAATSRFTDRPSERTLLGAVLAVFVLAGTLVMFAHGGVFPARPDSGRLDAAAVALAACSAIPLLAWHRFRFGVFTATAATGVLMTALGYPADLLFGATAALYLVAAHRETPWTRRSATLILGMFALYLLTAAVAQGGFPISELVHTGLAWAVAWFAGERTRLSRQHIEDLKQRAQRAERESERERLLAIAEERARIARDLHDSAGHAISLIAVRAGAARLRGDPEHSQTTLEAVEALARRTAAEIDEFVSALRDDRGVPAGLDSLSTLVAAHTDAGLRTRLSVSGEPRPLGTVADQAAYRILQEALTNAARHGTGSARIDLRWDGGGVEIGVTNPVRAHAEARPGGGHGIIGMRERASLIGADLEAARSDGEFRLRVKIPYGGRP